MSDKGGLQLLPETRKKIDIKIPGENRLLYVGGICVVTILVIYGILSAYVSNIESQVNEADKQLVDLENQRNKQEEETLLTLSKQITATTQVVKGRVHWSTGLGKIESALQPKVQFRSLSAVVADNSVRMRALTDSYVTVAKQLAAFVADDAVKDITLEGVNVLTNGKLDFNAKIEFDRSKFLKTQ